MPTAKKSRSSSTPRVRPSGARLVEDVEYKGCPIKAEERVLMNFPSHRP